MTERTADTSTPKHPADFITTHWTTVIQAASASSASAVEALERLCQAYWYPLFVFIRKKGYSPEDAEDLTQMFFAHVISKEALRNVDQAKGRFRSFLLAALTNFLANERDKRQTQKRGGRHQTLPFADCSPEELYRHEPVDDFTPERLFERRWALVVIDRVLQNLRREYENNGRGTVFAELERFLTVEADAPALRDCAQRLRMEEGGLKVAVHRLRRRFGVLLREEVSLTVATDDEIEAEIRTLMAAAAGRTM